MALDPVTNFGIVTVSTGYDASATSIVLTSGHGAKLPSTFSYNLVWWNSTDYGSPSDDPNVEIVRVTDRSTDTLTITRAQEGTSAATHNTGGKTYKMVLGATSKTITDIGSALDAKVAGPASATADHLAVYDGTTGKLIKDGGVVPSTVMTVNVETLSAGKTLLATDAKTQILDPNGANRVITMPSPTVGLEFWIFNPSLHDSPSYLYISSVYKVFGQSQLHCIADGTRWWYILVGSGGSSLGASVSTSLGTNADAHAYGTAIGNGAVGSYTGVAVGYLAEANSYAAVLGAFAKGNSKRGVAFGYYAKCERYKEFAVNPDQVLTSKDAYGIANWYGQTTNATQTELYSGGTASNRHVLIASSAIAFVLTVVAQSSTFVSKSWEVRGLIKRDASSVTSLVGSITKTVIAADTGTDAWDVTVAADDTNDCLSVNVTGAASTTIKWMVRGDTTEVRQ